MKLLAKLIATVGLTVGLAGGAQALNIVSNGSFETGDFTGWTLFGDTTFSGVATSASAPDGVEYAFFGPIGDTGGIQQTLATTPGGKYLVTFSFASDGGVTSSFLATFGGATLTSLSNPAAAAFHTLSFFVTATGASTVLAFTFRDDPGFLDLDAVSVSVPEPASLALLGIALGGMGFVRRRKV